MERAVRFFIALLLFGFTVRAEPLLYNKPVSIISLYSNTTLWVHPCHWYNTDRFCEILGGDPFGERDHNNSQLFLLKNKHNPEKSGPVCYNDDIQLYALGHSGVEADGFELFRQPCRLCVNKPGRNGIDGELVVEVNSPGDTSLASIFNLKKSKQEDGVIQQGDAVFISSCVTGEHLWQREKSRFGKSFKEYCVGDAYGRQHPSIGDRSKQKQGLFSLTHMPLKMQEKEIKKTQDSLFARWARPLINMKQRWHDYLKRLSHKRKLQRSKKNQ